MIIDQGCSRVATFLPCHMTITGEGVALLYLKNLLPWFRVPLKVISDRDPHFTSHFAQALTMKLSIGWNISTAFHLQTDGLMEHKNQWVKQYLHLYTSARQDNWDAWLPLATFVHNWWPNATTKRSPHELLLGYCPSAAEEPTGIMNNETVEERHQLLKQHREAALYALNEVARVILMSQYHKGEWVWLKAKYLALPYASAKLAPKHHGPFQIMKEISPVAYQLTLPRAWTIHNVFHSSLLMPYKETCEHGAQFQCPPPELIGNEEEYKVEQIINHWHHGKQCQLQYLICWKGYSAADDTWEPTDQVHTDTLVKSYHVKYAKEEERNKSQWWTKARATIQLLSACPLPTQPTSPLPLCLALWSTWTQPNPSQSGPLPKPQWSIDRTLSPSQPWLWQSPTSSVSYSFLPAQYVPLSKDIGHPEERNSSSLHKDWQELCERIKKSAAIIKNNSKYSSSKEKIWQSMKHAQLTWKQPMNTGRKIWIKGMPNGRERAEGLKGMRKMKDTSSTSSSWSLMETTPCMSSPHTSNWMGCTAWALSALTNPSTATNSSPLNASPSKKKGSSPTGSLKASSMTLHTWPCTTIPGPRKTGESQLSSNDITICMLKLLPWSQSKGVWPLPLRQPKSNWTKVNDAYLALMPISGINSSTPSTRAPTSTPSPRGNSPLSQEAHAMVQLDHNWGVMSQGSLQGGQENHWQEGWELETPRSGGAV